MRGRERRFSHVKKLVRPITNCERRLFTTVNQNDKCLLRRTCKPEGVQYSTDFLLCESFIFLENRHVPEPFERDRVSARDGAAEHAVPELPRGERGAVAACCAAGWPHDTVRGGAEQGQGQEVRYRQGRRVRGRGR